VDEPNLEVELANVVHEQYEQLREHLSSDQPFGPSNMAKVKERAMFRLLFDPEATPDADLDGSRSLFILGRRGSGKTAYLNEVLTEVRTYAVTLESPDLYYQVQQTAVHLEIANHPETVSLLWQSAIKVAVIAALVRRQIYANTPIADVECLEAFHKGLGASIDDPSELSTDDYVCRFLSLIRDVPVSDARRATIRHFLRSFRLGGVSLAQASDAAAALARLQRIRVAVLIDSLEDFTSGIDTYRVALGGLLGFVGQVVPDQGPHTVVRCCLPTEMYPALVAMSANRSKDFMNNSVTIAWNSRRMIFLAARRFWLFAETRRLTEPHGRIAPALLHRPGDPETAIDYFRTFLPESVPNRLNGVREDTLTYILRHTQLLPRQFLGILTHIVRLAGAEHVLAGGKISELDVSNGVRGVEALLWQEVAEAHVGKFPKMVQLAGGMARELPLVFDNSQVKAAWAALDKPDRLGIDPTQARRFLLEMGCIGRVVAGATNDRYVRGEFAYTFPDPSFDPATGDRLCLHPLFSETGAMRQSTDVASRITPVFPVGTETT
jgi:hypothetical protein